jgi:hypothetical protein
MTHEFCPHEEAAAEAARSGAWNDSLRAHAAGCATCREIAGTANWMQTLARETVTGCDAHEASLIWWKAQVAGKLVQKQAEADRAQEVAAWIEIVLAALVVAGIAGRIASGWQALQETAVSFWTSLAPQSWLAGGSALQSSSAFLWFFLAAVSIAAFFIVYPILAED